MNSDDDKLSDYRSIMIDILNQSYIKSLVIKTDLVIKSNFDIMDFNLLLNLSEIYSNSTEYTIDTHTKEIFDTILTNIHTLVSEYNPDTILGTKISNKEILLLLFQKE